MYYRSVHRSVVALAVTWAIFAFVVVNIYSSCLTSYTSLTYQRSEIVTFEDLAEHSEYGLSTVKGSIMEIALLESTILIITFYFLSIWKLPLFLFLQTAEKGPLKQIGNRLRSCGQNCSLTDFGQIQNKVLGDQQAAILVWNSLHPFMVF